MKIALVGHRGTGKTSYLEKLAPLLPGVSCVDLDRYIEKGEGKSVDTIFSQEGEGRFRLLEQSYFEELSQQENIVVALGAGFLGEIASDFGIFWLKRKSDPFPRIFFDRPRLSSGKKPSEEYLERFEEREARYKKWAHCQILLPETDDLSSDFVKRSFFSRYPDLGGVLTLLPSNLDYVFRNLEKLGVQYYEIRDDLWSDDEIRKLLHKIPEDKILYSFRKNTSQFDESLPGKIKDWDLSLGEVSGTPSIVSTHEKLSSIDWKKLVRHSNLGSHIKISPELESWEKLRQLEDKALESLNSFSILPRTPKGAVERKWNSFRNFDSHSKLRFFRVDEGSSVDQPFIDEFFLGRNTKVFAAVLGDPISHSYSPSFHQKFFQKYQMPFFDLRVERGELTDSLLSWFYDKGLRFAALTSPCKESLLKSDKLCFDVSVQSSQSINTLIWSSEKSQFLAFNTDTQAMLSELAELEMKKALIWGAGAIGKQIAQFYPEAYLCSLREYQGQVYEESKTIVWCGGAHGSLFPEVPHAEVLFDLSYTQFSQAREFALTRGIRYISGLEMFCLQAQLQQDLWEQYGQ